MCATVESTLAGVDGVSGIIAVVEDQAAFSDCHQLTSCSLEHCDGMCQLFEKWQQCKWCGYPGGEGGVS